MTQLLEKAFKQAKSLPVTEQNALARWLIEEMESERKWEEAFVQSEDILNQMASEAQIDYNKGKTNPMNIED